MPDWSPVDLLPGLWVGLLAVALAAALRRWYDPVPGPVLAAFGLALAVLFGPVLFGGKILLPLDNLRGHAPFAQLAPAEPHGNILQGDLIQLVAPSLAAVRTALADRRWPLWNPWVGAGMPLLADPQAQALQPLVLLALPMPLERAAGVTAALRVLVALNFSFLWMRRRGLGTGPSLAGAFGFGLGGFLLLWVGWPIANAAALLPLLLYALVRCDQQGGRRDVFLLGAATLALLLAGHPETIALTLALAAVFLLDQVRRRPAGRRLVLLRHAGLALIVAFAVAAPVLLPAADYLPHTLRAARIGEAARGLAGDPGGDLARRWLPVAAPNAYGNSRFVHYWGLSNTNEDAGGFAGTALLLAALLALAPLAPAARRFPQERTALVLAVLGLAGLALPALVALPEPLASRRILLPLAFCLSYAGACTLERFRQGEVRRRNVAIAAAALAAVIVWSYLAQPQPDDPDRLAVFRLGWLRWQLRFLAAAALLLLLARGRRWRPGATVAVAALVGAELLLAHGPANPPMPRRLAFPINEPVRFLRENLLAADALGDRMAALGRAFPPNLPSLYGLSDARVYNPMAPREYLAYTAPIVAGWWGELPQLGTAEHPLYRRLGVRYLLVAPRQRLPAPWQLVHSEDDAWVYERKDRLPRLFLSPLSPGLKILELREAWITARYRSGSDRELITSLYQEGGWRLLLKGRLLPGHRAHGPFVAARLPAGRGRLELLYRPRAFLLGCLIAPWGLALGALAWVPPPRRQGERGEVERGRSAVV